MGACALIFFMFLAVTGIVGKQLVVKVKEDLSLHNSQFIEPLAVFPYVDISTCAHSCEKQSHGLSNLRLYNPVTRMCKCFFAKPDDFRDSRKVAPRMNGELFLTNSKLFTKILVFKMKFMLFLQLERILDSRNNSR